MCAAPTVRASTMEAQEGWDDYEEYAGAWVAPRRAEPSRDAPRAVGPEPRLGWLLNMVPTTFQRGDAELSGLELFLLSADAKHNFRVTIA